MIAFNELEVLFIAICLEGFFYDKISVLCALACTLAKEVQLFPGLGLYSGIFAMYLQCASKDSRTAIIVFYILCLLYVLSTATVVSDLLALILEVSNNFVCKKFFFISCAVAYQHRRHHHLSPCDCPNHSKRLLWLRRPMYHSTHKPLYLSSRFIHLNLQRSTVVGLCGVKISLS